MVLSRFGNQVTISERKNLRFIYILNKDANATTIAVCLYYVRGLVHIYYPVTRATRFAHTAF